MSRLLHPSKRKAVLAITLGLAAALLLPISLRQIPHEPRSRVIEFEAQKYGYSPARIIVNRGDTVILKPTSLDVTHGFLLDGHDVEAIIKQEGLAYLKYVWLDDEGQAHTDWDKVRRIEFTAENAGKFTFRCTQTCGNLHPFMTGELIVRPNTPYHFYAALSLWLVLSLLVWFSVGERTGGGNRFRVDLFKTIPLLEWVVKKRSFQFLVILPTLLFFYLFVLSALWGSPVGNRNIAIIFVWILWWTLLKAVLLPLGGRIWCLVCPLPAPGEWLARKTLSAVRVLDKPLKGIRHRYLGLNKDWPRGFNNIWLQNALFLIMISFGIILITRPVATAILFLIILAASVILSLIFRGRAFCRFLCPVGGFLSTYSMAACTELRVVDPEVCRTHKEKCCLVGGEGGWACPWGQYLGGMDRNNYCGLCTECVKSCPKDNVGFFLRPFGSDRNLRGWDETYNVLIMLMVALIFTVTMLGPWQDIKRAANVSESRQWFPFAGYVAVVFSLTLAVFPGIFALSVKAAKKVSNTVLDFRSLAFSLAYIFIPMGIFVWIAFSLPMVMINYSYILSVLSDPMGLGWDLMNTAGYPFKPFLPEAIPYFQGTLVLAGLYFGLTRAFYGLTALESSKTRAVRAMVIPALLALVVANIFLKLYMG